MFQGVETVLQTLEFGLETAEAEAEHDPGSQEEEEEQEDDEEEHALHGAGGWGLS
jgi:hypothetical protein